MLVMSSPGWRLQQRGITEHPRLQGKGDSPPLVWILPRYVTLNNEDDSLTYTCNMGVQKRTDAFQIVRLHASEIHIFTKHTL